MAKVLKKFLALVLVLAVVMSMTGMTAFAMDDDETIVETEATVVIDADEGEENDEAPVEEETPVEDEAPAEEAAPVEEEAPAEEEAILDTQSGEDEAEEDDGTEADAVVFLDGEGYATFPEAVEAANEKGGGTIVVPEGTTVYVTGSGTAPVKILSTITITGGGTVKRGEGCTGCVIHVGEVMSMTATGNLTLENITLDGGAIWTGDVDPVLGRGTVNVGLTSVQAMIRVDGMESSLILKAGAVLQNNDDTTPNAPVGAGAIKVDYGATLEMYDGAVIRNNAGRYGGAFKFDYVSKVPVISGGEIYGNAATLTSEDKGGIGGAIVIDSYLDLSNVTIRNNWAATLGGAIYSFATDDPDNPGVLNIHEGTVIRDNAAEDRGAGVYINSGTVTIDGGSITDNTAKGNGGGVYILNGTLTIDGVSITGNTAKGKYGGGGVYVNAGTVTIDGGSISGNKADVRGGGITIMTGTLTITGGNITDNTANTAQPCFAVGKSDANPTVVTLFGGTFDREVDTYVAEAYKAIDNGDGTWTVVIDPDTAVAQIKGGLAYTSLQKAINAAEDGDTVVLLKDVAESVTVTAEQNITLDLNGKTLNNADGKDAITVVMGGSLEISGGTIEMTDNGKTKSAIVNRGTVTVSDVTIRRATTGTNYLVVNEGNMSMTRTSATMTRESGQASMIHNAYASYNRDRNATNWEYPELTIDGGTFICTNDTAIKNDDGGILTISENSGEVFVSGGVGFFSVLNANEARISGGSFNGPIVNYGFGGVNDGTLEISGGNFVHYENYYYNIWINGSDEKVAISGGTFSVPVELDWCADGYRPVELGEDSYGVTDADITVTATPATLAGAGDRTITLTDVSEHKSTVEVVIYGYVAGTNPQQEIELTHEGDTWTTTTSMPNEDATYIFNLGIKPTDGDAIYGFGTVVVTADRYTAPVTPVTPVTPSEPENTDEPTVEIDDEGTALADRPFLFEDVLEDDWFYGDVKNIFENGLINGTTTTTYEPQTELSRGMIVTILWRIAGEPTVETTSTFADVPENAYYFDAINWGAENNIARGYDEETFAPDKLVSREELAAFIYRYAELIELDLTEIDEDAFAEFGDAESVQEFAITAMKWAVSAGIIKGDDGMLNPQNSATRAEAAAMINRFIQLPEVAAVMAANAETEGETEAE